MFLTSSWLSSLLDEITIIASSHEEKIEYILLAYNISWKNLLDIIGDNVSISKALASVEEINLIGGASDRFNLAMCGIFESQENAIEIIREIMVKL